MKKKLCLLLSICMMAMPVHNIKAQAASGNSYRDYQDRSKSLVSVKNLSRAGTGMKIEEDHTQIFKFENFGKLNFVPVIDEQYGKLTICLTDSTGTVKYKTNYMECNNLKSGNMLQYYEKLLAVSLEDVDKDGRTDIVLISECSYRIDGSILQMFKVADILFQKKNGFYSNWEIPNKINKFSMNSNLEMVTEFTSGKDSMEFLYTSTNFTDVTDNGFKVHKKHTFTVDFEEFGQVTVYPGFYPMGGLRTFLIYLVDSQDRICALLEPMKAYDDLVELKSISFADVNNDGLKDITIQAYFRYCREVITEKELDDVTFLQDSLWFERDLEMEKNLELKNPKTMAAVVAGIRKYYAKK